MAGSYGGLLLWHRAAIHLVFLFEAIFKSTYVTLKLLGNDVVS